MEIGKINLAIEQTGYNPFGISGTGEDDAKKLAQKNGISVEEAQKVLKEAEKKAQEDEHLKTQQAEMLGVLNTQDEEELVSFDDNDFDNFLNNIDAETQMQNMLNRQQFVRQDNNQMQNQENSSQNSFAPKENPFTKLKY